MKKKKSYWISSGKFTLLQRISMLFFGVLTFYLLVRILDKQAYGIWMLFISTTALLDTARNGFFKNPLVRYLNKTDSKNKSELQATSFCMNMLYSVITSLLMIGLSYLLEVGWEAPGLTSLFYVYFLTNLFLAIFYHCEYMQVAHFRFKGLFVGYFLRSGVLFVFVTVFYFTSFTLDIVLLGICYGIAALMGAAAMFLYSRDLLKLRLHLHKKWMLKLFAYGKYTFGTNISAVFMRNVDTWMLGWYISPVAVAVYNVAIRIANLFEVPSMALASILFPKAVKQAENQGEKALKGLYEKYVTLILLLTLPFVILVISFSNELVVLLAGENYAEAGFILNITMLYGLIIPFNKQMGVLLDAVGKAKINMLFVIRNAAINIILNAIMIPYFGLMGAAYATLSTMIIVFIINQVYLSRNFNIELKSLITYSRYFVLQFRKKLS